MLAAKYSSLYKSATFVTQDQIQLLLLIIVANGAPIVLRALLKNRFDTAIDFGYRLAGNSPLFGKSKTWRGFTGSVVITSIGAVLLGYSMATGALIAVYAILGDLFSSFIKRRLGLAPSSMAPLLDQVPESLLPALMLKDSFGLDTKDIMILVSVFIVAELILSKVLYKLGIRNRPY